MSANDLPSILQSQIDVLLIDNFDSFTYNLYQSLGILGCTPVVIRNDLISPSLFPFLDIKALIISPGPGHPHTDSGISRDAIKYFAGKVPILGVCMGLECVVDVYGGEIAYAGEIMHGKLSEINHDGRGIFKSIPQGFRSTRYHSLSASLTSLPSSLAITATTTSSGVIMGVRHRKYTVESVQYHPESILSEHGDTLLNNFLKLKGGTWEENPDCGVLDATLPPFPIEALKINGNEEVNKPKAQTILEKIYAQRLKDVALAKSTPGTTPADLSTLLSMNLTPPLIPFVPRLLPHHSSTPAPPALMAEIKRASPSKGDIAASASAPAQALLYALSGASVISVLTEPKWFRGSLADLAAVRQAVSHLPNRPAILRKDFVLDEYQIAEARIHGADTVLLIVAMLPPHRLKALYAYSLKLGMEPLVEVNNASEMTAALDLGAKVIGVNNRNLHDFTVDLETTSRLADMVRDKGVVLCALSGIASSADVQRYSSQGIGAILVGEALMRARDTRAFIRNLLSLDPPAPSSPSSSPIPLVKICGIRTAAEALACSSAGADMLGLMFVPSSKRVISLSTAQEISSVVRDRPVSSSSPPPSSLPPTALKPWFTTHAEALKPLRPLLVGVFQNQPLEHILDVVSFVQLDMVQLHGNEPVEWARFIPVPVIKVFGVEAASAVSPQATEGENGVTQSLQNRPSIPEITRQGYHHFVLLDSIRDSTGLSGGTGKTVDWESARRVVDAGEFIIDENLLDGGSGQTPSSQDVSPPTPSYPPFPLPIILAGGLTPSNVTQAIAKVRPWAVDVSGGVENAGGTGKDAEKVSAFIGAVKGQEQENINGHGGEAVKVTVAT